MGLEIISAIKLIGNLIQSVSANINTFKGTPKQRFGKMLLSLLSIIREAQDSLPEVIETLDELLETNSSHRIADSAIREFSNACHRFISWVEKNKHFSNTLDLLSPESGEILKRSMQNDISYIDRANVISAALREEWRKKIYWAEGKPTKEDLSRLKQDLINIEKQLELMKMELRKLAKDNLTIEDLF